MLSDRDLMLIERIQEDIQTVKDRVTYFGATAESFGAKRTFEGEIAYDAIMNPVYRIVEDTVHISDDLMARHEDYPWHKIRGFRNFIAHGYSEIDRSIAWKVIEQDLPELADILAYEIAHDGE